MQQSYDAVVHFALGTWMSPRQKERKKRARARNGRRGEMMREKEREKETGRDRGPQVSVKSPQTIVRSSSRDITDPAVRLFRVRYAARMRNAAAFQALRSRCTTSRRAGASAHDEESGRASERASEEEARRRSPGGEREECIARRPIDCQTLA